MLKNQYIAHFGKFKNIRISIVHSSRAARVKLLIYYTTVYTKTKGYKVIKEIEGKNIKLVDASIMSVCLNLFLRAKYRIAQGRLRHLSAFLRPG